MPSTASGSEDDRSDYGGGAPNDWAHTRVGTAVLAGVPEGMAEINAFHLLINGKRLIASIRGSGRPDRDFAEFVRWYKGRQLDLNAWVTKRVRLDEIEQAAANLRPGKVLGRSIIEFE